MLAVSFLVLCFFVKLAFPAELMEPTATLPADLAALVTLDMLPHLYFHDEGYFFLPPSTDSRKLFEKVNPDLISEIMRINEGKYRNFFIVPIWRDYIVSYFLGEEPADHQTLQVLVNLPFIYDTLQKPVEQLLWCLFFATGSVQRAKSNAMSKIVKGFRGLGFVWKFLRSGSHNTNYFACRAAGRVATMLPIYITARCFNIDISAIAKKVGNACHLSTMLNDGEIPLVLQNPGQFDCQPIFFSIYEAIPILIAWNVMPMMNTVPALMNFLTPMINPVLPTMNPVPCMVNFEPSSMNFVPEQPRLLFAHQIRLCTSPSLHSHTHAVPVLPPHQDPILGSNSQRQPDMLPPFVPMPSVLSPATQTASMNGAAVIFDIGRLRKRNHSPDQYGPSKKRGIADADQSETSAAEPIMAIVLDEFNDSDDLLGVQPKKIYKKGA